MLDVMVLRGGAFGSCWGHGGGALINGINPLIKETPQSSLPLSPFEDTEVGSLQPGRGHSPDHTGTLVLDCQLPEWWEISVVSKLPRMWNFVLEALIDLRHTRHQRVFFKASQVIPMCTWLGNTGLDYNYSSTSSFQKQCLSTSASDHCWQSSGLAVWTWSWNCRKPWEALTDGKRLGPPFPGMTPVPQGAPLRLYN